MGASKKTVQSNPPIKRNYSSKREHDQDCFKLMVSTMVKNKTDYFGDSPKIQRTPSLESIEHCHFFYSVDKRGNAQTHSCATGGHKHEVKYWVEDGELKAECGPPISYGGKVHKSDHHTHEVMYIKSAKVHSKLGQERAKEIAAYVEKTAPKTTVKQPLMEQNVQPTA